MKYTYWCDPCQANFEIVRSMKDATTVEPCPTCGGECGRDFQAEGATPSAAVGDWNKYPYVSKRLPKNLEGCQTNKFGQPVIESKSHEREVMAKHRYRRE